MWENKEVIAWNHYLQSSSSILIFHQMMHKRKALTSDDTKRHQQVRWQLYPYILVQLGTSQKTNNNNIITKKQYLTNLHITDLIRE
jgi:hypothetical protein